MSKLNLRQLQDRGAAIAGEHREETRKLVLLYCGVIAALSLGSNGLHLLLDSRMSSTGGLDGLGMRSVLQTIQQVLSLVNTFFSPFWSAGFLFAMLGLVRGKVPESRDMLEGFRRFGRILTSTIYQMLLGFSLGLASFMISMLIFTVTPWGTAVAELLEPVLADPNLILADGTVNMALFPTEAMTMGVIPLMVLWLVLFLGLYGYISYCFRMGTYLMMERRIGGVAALFESRRLMRGHKIELLKLDFRFWWYYVLLGLVSVVGYLDVILAQLGIDLPLDATVMFFLTLAGYCLLLTALSLWKKCEVDAAYLLAYEAIAHPEPTESLSEIE